MLKKIRNKTAPAVILSCICMLLSSCGHHAPPGKVQRKIDPAISSVLRQLQGSWICYDYTQHLARTQSPYHSSAYIDGIFSFVIDSNNTSGDTLHFTALVRGQEDNSLWIALGKRDPNGRYPAWQKKSTDPNASPNDNIVKARIDSGYLMLYTGAADSIRYTYYDSQYRGRTADYILRQYTTTTLFEGAYTTRDSPVVFGSSHIAFDPVHIGRLTGSPLYDSFEINMDILVQQDTADYIELYDTRGATESHSYIYRISGNTLKVYRLNDGASCSLIKYQDTTAH